MKPPTNPPPGDRHDKRDQTSGRRPGGHGGYKPGGEPAVGHRWHEASPPPPATMTRFDDGVPHRHHEPGEIDPLHNEDVDHEHQDIDIGAVIGSAVVLTVVVVVSMGLMWGLFEALEYQAQANDPEVSPLARPGVEMPRTTQGSPYFNPGVGGPQLMVNEPLQLSRQREEEQKRLNGYGWVNQGAGVAFMPIEEAKKLIRERGLPVREGNSVSPTLGSNAPSRGEASGGRMLVIGGQPANAPGLPPAPDPSETPHSGAPTAKPQGTGKH